MNFEECRNEVNTIILNYLSPLIVDKRIKEGMQYILEDGKRLRAVITLAILQQLQPDHWKKLENICLVPEFIHTASLVIDDLPAFDNALMRRGKECIHIKQSEGLAYLLSLNLLSDSMMIAHKQLHVFKAEYGKESAYEYYDVYMQNVIKNISADGAITGQLLSTYHLDSGIKNTEHIPKEEICRILEKKTATFFEIAIISGWLAGHGSLDKLEEIAEMSRLMGLCYQIYDDFDDYAEDIQQYSHNYVYHRGLDNALQEFNEYHRQLTEIIEQLGLKCTIFDYILMFLKKNVEHSRKNMKTI